MHLAQLNVGRLVAETDDPRVAEFMAALDRVNGLGKRMPGFVWMMEGSGEPGTGNTETKIGGDPRFVVEPDGLGERRGARALRLEHRAPAVLRAAARVVRGARRAALGDVVGARGAPAERSTRRWRGSTTCGRTATATTPSAGPGSRRRGSGGSGTATRWRRSRRWNRTTDHEASELAMRLLGRSSDPDHPAGAGGDPLLEALAAHRPFRRLGPADAGAARQHHLALGAGVQATGRRSAAGTSPMTDETANLILEYMRRFERTLDEIRHDRSRHARGGCRDVGRRVDWRRRAGAGADEPAPGST